MSSNPGYLSSHPVLLSSFLQYIEYNTSAICVSSKSLYIWHHICTLWQQPLEFITSHALYSLHHTHYIWHLIYSVWCHIHYVCYITQWLYLWHQMLYVYDIFTLYGIRHSVTTTLPLCAFTATRPELTLSVYDISSGEWMTTQWLYLTWYPLYVCNQTHLIDDITP